MPLTIDELRDEIAHHIEDPAKALINNQQLLEFINSAAWDAANQDVLIDLQDDESVTLATDTFEYAVPSNFSYIHDLWEETAEGSGVYTNWIPWARWRLKMGGANVPTLWFDNLLYTVTDALTVRILGQGRPTTEYSDGSDNIDTGLESFIRERAIAYAARNLSSKADGPRAQAAAALAQEAYETSENLLKFQQELFSPKRFSRKVPGR